MSEPSTVLVVDDEIGPRESLRAILKPEHKVLVAAEGEQAIRMVEEAPVDVVLLDLRMPGVSGIRVLERLKAINPEIEVILITGYASYETVLEAMRLHAFDYIPKPFNIPQLRDLVRRAVARRHSYMRKSPADDIGEARRAAADPPQSELTAEAELMTARKELEKLYTVLSRNCQGAIRTLEEGAAALATTYASQFDAPGKEILQRMQAASAQLARCLQEAAPQETNPLTPSWSAMTPSMSTACAQ